MAFALSILLVKPLVSDFTSDLIFALFTGQFLVDLRYELEAEGQQFLRDYDARAAAGAVTAEDRQTTIERNGYTLQIRVSAPDGNGDFEIEKWDLNKDWNADDPFTHIWKGANQ